MNLIRLSDSSLFESLEEVGGMEQLDLLLLVLDLNSLIDDLIMHEPIQIETIMSFDLLRFFKIVQHFIKYSKTLNIQLCEIYSLYLSWIKFRDSKEL